MTIKHKEEIRITELGDNKVMKQAVDNAFFNAFTENDIKPFFLYDALIYIIRIIYVCFAFVNYFNYKDYFSGTEMVVIYYLFCGIDYIINFIFIKNYFFIGTLPHGSKYSYAKDFRAESQCDFGDEEYKLTISAVVKDTPVDYTFTRSIANYFDVDGLLHDDVVNADTVMIMDEFRSRLHKAAAKKNN